jgi:hypothetical protein
MYIRCRSQWPRGLRRRSSAARLLRLRFRIPSGALMFVYCEFCVFSGTSLCDEPPIDPQESCLAWWVVVCYLETSRMRTLWPALGHSATDKKKLYLLHRFFINMSHPVVYIILKYLFSVYIMVNKRQPFLVSQMATCFGCDYSHHQANV